MTTQTEQVYVKKYDGLSGNMLWEVQCYLGREGARTFDKEKREGHVYLEGDKEAKMNYKTGTLELTEGFSEREMTDIEALIKSVSSNETLDLRVLQQ